MLSSDGGHEIAGCPATTTGMVMTGNGMAAIGLISRGRRPYGSPATGVIDGGAGPGFPATGSERGPSLIGRFADGTVSRDDETVA